MHWDSRYIGDTYDVNGASDTLGNHANAIFYHDLSASYNLKDIGGVRSVKITVGIDNLFDRDPPFIVNDISATNALSAAGYDFVGRFFYVKSLPASDGPLNLPPGLRSGRQQRFSIMVRVQSGMGCFGRAGVSPALLFRTFRRLIGRCRRDACAPESVALNKLLKIEKRGGYSRLFCEQRRAARCIGGRLPVEMRVVCDCGLAHAARDLEAPSSVSSFGGPTDALETDVLVGWDIVVAGVRHPVAVRGRCRRGNHPPPR